jgi:hypothetical protein
MIYVLFLCCVDLASVVPLPMAIMDQVCHKYPGLSYAPRLLVLNLASIWGLLEIWRVSLPSMKKPFPQPNKVFILNAVDGYAS